MDTTCLQILSVILMFIDTHPDDAVQPHKQRGEGGQHQRLLGVNRPNRSVLMFCSLL